MLVRSSVISLIFVVRSSKSSGFRQAKSLLLCHDTINRIRKTVELGEPLSGLAQIVVDAAANAHRAHDCTEVIVEQHETRRFTRDVAAARPHRDADVRGLQC